MLRWLLACPLLILLPAVTPAQYVSPRLTTCGCNSHATCTCQSSQCACSPCGHADRFGGLPITGRNTDYAYREREWSFRQQAVPQYFSPGVNTYQAPQIILIAPTFREYREPRFRESRFDFNLNLQRSRSFGAVRGGC